jgi:hypothetical protein
VKYQHRVGLVLLLFGIIAMQIRFGTDNERVEGFFAILAYVFFAFGVWMLLSKDGEDE